MITNLNNYLNTNYPSIEQQIKRIISNLSTSWEDFLANTEPNGMEIRHSGWPNTKMYVGEDGVIRATAGVYNKTSSVKEVT